MRFVRVSAGGQGTLHLHLISIPDDRLHLSLRQRTEPELLKSEVRAVGQRMDRIYQCSIEIKDQTLIFHICLHQRKSESKKAVRPPLFRAENSIKPPVSSKLCHPQNCATHFITNPKT